MKDKFRIRFVLLLIISSIKLQAQTCQYSGYGAIVVKVQNVPKDLKITLVNGITQPIEAVCNNNNNTGLCAEPYMFWQNNSNKIPPQTCKYNKLFRESFPNLDDAFVCIVPLQNKEMDCNNLLGFRAAEFFNRTMETEKQVALLRDSLQWHLKVETKNSVQYIKLPLHCVIDLCEQLLENEFVINPIDLATKTIELTLNKENKFTATIDPAVYNNYLLPVYVASSTAFAMESHSLVRVLVYNDSCSCIVQNIVAYKDGQNLWHSNANQKLELLNWNNTYVYNKKMFRVPSQTIIKSTNNEQPYMYYSYNSKDKKYELDKVFNQLDFIDYNTKTFKITAYKYSEQNSKNTIEQYELQSNKWHWTKTKYLDAENKFATPQKLAIITCTKPTKCLPLQYFKNESVIATDTFWIKNIGDTLAEVTLDKVAPFSFLGKKWGMLKATILVQDSIAILYHRTFVQESANNFTNGFILNFLTTVIDFATLKSNNQIITLNCNYPIVKETASLEIQADGSKIFTTKSSNLQPVFLNDSAIVKQYISTYTNGYIKDYGTMYYHNKYSKNSATDKLGKWQQYQNYTGNSIPKFKEEVHTKLLTLTIANDSIKNCWYEYGFMWSIGNRNYFKDMQKNIGDRITIPLYDNAADITIGSSRGSIRYPLFKFLDNEIVTLYLLKDGEPYYYNQGIKVPRDSNSEVYKVNFTWQYATLITKPKTIVQDPYYKEGRTAMLNYFQTLKKGYNNLNYYMSNEVKSANKFKGKNIIEHSHNPLELYLDLSKCTNAEKQAIKQAIIMDNNISSISLVMQKNTKLFANGGISINTEPIPIATDTSLINFANLAGFEKDKTIAMPYQNNTVFLRYNTKIIDEQFFIRYNMLCEKYLYYNIILQTDRPYITPNE